MQTHTDDHQWFIPPSPRWRDLFEERYGDGALDDLIRMLAQPCVTFAAIAEEFGVTRERVRQWHLQLMPEAPRGHERQRLCATHHSKRRLLSDPLFRSFYRHARSQVAPNRFVLVPAREGFRKRVVRLDNRTIGIRGAATRSAPVAEGATTYLLTRCAEPVDLIYDRLCDRDYLGVPGGAVPGGGVVYKDRRSSALDRFRNTFAAALGCTVAEQQAC
jgi:hypothetical protein